MKKVFISAVTSEFKDLRPKHAELLRRQGYEPVLQETVVPRLSACTTLERLAEDLDECWSAIFLVGYHGGDKPPDQSIESFRRCLPSGWSQATYTQWEYFLWNSPGRNEQRPAYNALIFFLEQPVEPCNEESDIQELQEHFRAYLESQFGADRRHIRFTMDSMFDQALILYNLFPRLPHVRPVHLSQPTLGNNFVGRNTDLIKILSSWERAKSGGQSKHSIWIHGLSGIGKTQLAVEFAVREKDQFSAILMVSCATTDSLLASYASLAAPQILNLPEQEHSDLAIRCNAVHRWLNEHGSGLLIVDNVDTAVSAAAAKELLRNVTGGLVLVTGQYHDHDPHFDEILIESLDVTDAAEYILSRTKNDRQITPSDDEYATKLARRIGGHCKALEVATSFICEQRITIETFVERLARRVTLLNEDDVRATFLNTMDRLGGYSRTFLNLFARLAPVPVHTSHIHHIADYLADASKVLNIDYQSNVASSGIETVLHELDRYSLLTFSQVDATYTMHPMLRAIIEVNHEQETRRQLSQLAVEWLLRAIPEEMFSDDTKGTIDEFNELEALSPHLLKLLAEPGLNQSNEQLEFIVAFYVIHASKQFVESAQLLYAALHDQLAAAIVPPMSYDQQRDKWRHLAEQIKEIWEQAKHLHNAYPTADHKHDERDAEEHLNPVFGQQSNFDYLIAICCRKMAECSCQLGEYNSAQQELVESLERLNVAPELYVPHRRSLVSAFAQDLELVEKARERHNQVQERIQEHHEVLTVLERLMNVYSVLEQYEEAASIRDALRDLPNAIAPADERDK